MAVATPMMTSNNAFEWKPFSNKALDFLFNANSYLNIAVGAIRSGKTIVALARFLKHICESKHRNFLMAGNTIGALKRNCIDPFCSMLDDLHIPYRLKMSNQEPVLLVQDKYIALFGLDKEGTDKRIRGYTSAGAFVDEITTMPQSSFEMLVSRNSLPGSKIFCTCNPVSPLNFVKTDYIDNTEAQKTGYLKVYNFLLEDNLTLSDDYVKALKSLYAPTSVFYKRNILGLWASGQGLIFPSFDENNILQSFDLQDYYKFELGMDYGSSNMTCYSLIGFTEIAGRKEWHQIHEKYYDAKREGVGQTDAERVEDILKIQENFNLSRSSTFYTSHDAGNLETALRKDKRIHMKIKQYMPDSKLAIQTMDSLFYTNQLKIYKGNTETIKQLRGYEWDSKAAGKGEDRPVKIDDHLIDSLRAPIMYGRDKKKVRSRNVRLR